MKNEKNYVNYEKDLSSYLKNWNWFSENNWDLF